MQQNQGGGLTSRLRTTSMPLRLALLAIPVVATAGALGLPSIASASGDRTGNAAGRLVAVSLPATSASPVPITAAAAPPDAGTVSTDAALEAFFGGGHDYDDAVALAKLWKSGKSGEDLGDVKATAGRKLLAGHPLPL
jgi:hypothetical protein